MARTTTAPAPVAADPGIRDSRFDERLSFLIHRLHARLAQEAGKLFRAHDLDPVSSRILVLLLAHRGMRVGELVEILVLPQSTVSHQLRRMVTAGLIDRNRPSDDNRSVVVSLTPHGAEIAAECDALSRMVHDRMVAGLSHSELATLRALLRRVFGTLDDMRTPVADDDSSAPL